MLKPCSLTISLRSAFNSLVIVTSLASEKKYSRLTCLLSVSILLYLSSSIIYT